MHDTDDRVVAASLRALATCVGIVGGAAVTGAAHRRHFADALPRVRAPPLAKVSASDEHPVPNALDEHADEHNVVKQVVNEAEANVADDIDRNVNEQLDVASTVNTGKHTTTWSDDWNDNEARASPAVSTASSSRTARAHTDQLGAEFDIVANVTITSAHNGHVDDEPDYFVDMQPTVKRSELKPAVDDSAASSKAADKFKMTEVR
ncbi:unnamed protein product [Sphagnum balticum]